ncbi:MAG: hypothetical protein AAF389_08145 [Gemmatimonadota bacterium]
MARNARTAFLIATVLGTAGCHSYTPVSTPMPGSTVRVRVPVASALADPNAPPQTASIEGQVVESGDTLVLATRNRQEYGAFREIVQYDTVRLGPDQRYSVELSEFSTGKSVALGLAITGGAALLAATAFGGGGGDDSPIPGGPPPPQPIVISNGLISSILGLLGGS